MIQTSYPTSRQPGQYVTARIAMRHAVIGSGNREVWSIDNAQDKHCSLSQILLFWLQFLAVALSRGILETCSMYSYSMVKSKPAPEKWGKETFWFLPARQAIQTEQEES
jgi:hypothetical protein